MLIRMIRSVAGKNFSYSKGFIYDVNKELAENLISAGHAELSFTFTTPEGGFAVRAINKTGSTSVKGTVVATDTSDDFAFRVCPGNAPIPAGVVYEDGVPDGEMCWFVISGVADVLLKDGESAVRGYWVGLSDVAGRSYQAQHTGQSIPEQAEHNKEIGHSMETKDSGTDVLARCILHFN